MIETPQRFVRDTYTWLAYGLLGYFAFFQISLGVVIPFLRSELGFSYTVGGFHVSALALGSILCGAFSDRILRRFGRQRVLWASLTGLTLGAVVLAAGQSPFITVPGFAVIGLFGTTILVIVNATLSDKHQGLRAYALTESNIVAALVATASPLIVGGAAALGLGWRVGFLLPLLVWVYLLLSRVALRVVVPPSLVIDDEKETGSPTPPLSSVYWIYWVALVLGTSAEWSVNAWSVIFLDDWVGLPESTAASLFAVLLASGTMSRIVFSALTRRFDIERLLIGSLVLGCVGFTVFWLAETVPLTIFGMMLTGVGLANIYPLMITIITGVAPNATDLAVARASMGVGIAILVMPQLLGTLADIIGIFPAFGMTLLILLLALIVTIYAIYVRQTTTYESLSNDLRKQPSIRHT